LTNIIFESLAEQINTELRQNERLGPYGLMARVSENGVVQIQGIVDVLDEKRQAEELIWRFPGVRKVENDITVCTDGDIDDGDVAFEVGEELRANSEIPATVGAKVSGGEVQLVGSVNNLNEVAQAMETAGKARGVREVHSQLKLEEELDDDDIVNHIQMALLEELGITPGKVKVLSNHGMVTLSGGLPKPEAALAEAIASRQSGVRDVENKLGMD
jgi:hyperosmotically inducible protein